MSIETTTAAASDSPAPALVRVYNHSPATYRHGSVSVPPGGEAEIPEDIADKWRRVSNGLVGPSKHNPAPSALESSLRLEQAKNAALEKKIQDMEAKQAELEKQLSAKGRR